MNQVSKFNFTKTFLVKAFIMLSMPIACGRVYRRHLGYVRGRIEKCRTSAHIEGSSFIIVKCYVKLNSHRTVKVHTSIFDAVYLKKGDLVKLKRYEERIIKRETFELHSIIEE